MFEIHIGHVTASGVWFPNRVASTHTEWETAIREARGVEEDVAGDPNDADVMVRSASTGKHWDSNGQLLTMCTPFPAAPDVRQIL